MKIKIKMIPTVRHTMFDEAADAASAAAKAAADAAAAKAAADAAAAGKKFSQDDVNKFVAEERRKAQTQTQKAIEELEAIKAKADMTQQERADLETRLETMKNELLSKEDLAKKEIEKSKKTHETEVARLNMELGTWKDRYTESTIQRSIADAAAEQGAYHSEQITAILRNNTRLVEVLGEDNKPNGSFVPKVKFSDEDDKGNTITLELDVPAAVKRMKGIERYQNLFKGDGTGGAGGTGNQKSGRTTPLAKLAATDPAAYREARKKGQIQ